MPLDPIDRIAGRIAQETRAARRARHPRARIAHFMLADAYRGLVRKLLREGEPTAVTAPPTATPYETAATADPGFLADRSA